MRWAPPAWLAASLLFAVPFAGAAPPVPTPIGAGAMFHPDAANPRVSRGQPIAGLRCTRAAVPRFGIHLELFARGRVVLVPAGVGIAAPLERSGVYVLSGRCSYAARTREPTGVVEVATSAQLTLADFFRVWGRPLGPRRLVGFQARAGERVIAFVGGRRWRGGVGAIPLRRHAQIVLELGLQIPPHASYRFPKGL